jgi:crossover junction endodeoxyribonuclease RuvC
MALVFGIDPGLANTGWGVIDYSGTRISHVSHGTIITSSDLALPERLDIIYRGISSELKKYRPESCGVEALFFAKNVKTAIPVAQARGVALLACARNSVAVGEYTPVQIKQSVVGSGRADKQQVIQMVSVILGGEVSAGSEHAFDALAAAVCHAHSAGVLHV